MTDEDETELDVTNESDDMQLDATVVKLAEGLASIFRKRKDLNADARELYSNADKLGIPPRSLQHAVAMVRVMDRDERKQYQSGVRRVIRALEPAIPDLFAEDMERIKKRKAKAKERAAKEAAKMGGESPEAQERRLAADTDPRNDPKTGGAGGKVNGRGKAKDTPAKRGRKPKEAVAPATAVDRAIETAERQQRLREAQEAGPGASATIHDTVAAGDALISSTAAQLNAAAEQSTGDSILSAHIAEMDKRANEHTVSETEGVDATGLTGKPMSQSEIAAQKMREAGLA